MFAGPLPLAVLVIAFAAVGAWEWARITRTAGPMWTAAGWLVLAAACAAIVWIRDSIGLYPALWLFGAVWATDIGAYAVGKWLGGPRIAPAISPHKTWAGLAGGMALTAGWSATLAAYHHNGSEAQAVVLGAAFAILAQTGDFSLSFAKRRAGFKDSSGLIPGHGGVLDRIAGLLTTGPALALLLLATRTTVDSTGGIIN